MKYLKKLTAFKIYQFLLDFKLIKYKTVKINKIIQNLKNTYFKQGYYDCLKLKLPD